MRVPVRVTRMDLHGATLEENTMIEFGTAAEILFSAVTPLEFGDSIHVENPEGLLDAEARVVAVQYHEGRTAVAARFKDTVRNWVIRR